MAKSRQTVLAGDLLLVQRTIRIFRLFKHWPQEPLNELCASIRLIRVGRGETVIRQGEVVRGLYGIVTGRVEIGSAQLDGRRYIRLFGAAGQNFGFLSMFDGKGSPYFYTAQEPTTILFVDKSAFLSLLSRHPKLWLSVAQELAHLQRTTIAAIQEQIFESLHVRVARALVSAAKTYGLPDGSVSAVNIKLTQDAIAALLGVTRQSVSKELKSFEHAGLVKINYGQITLANPQALERIAQG
ncbi:MAG: Crp/Fnr family transcriptional regulator [Betaproteobacteria bacterium]|nr:MAG: Crp/Fnr family transcriptional regulator [Betaproteobacteria bacterium]